MAVKHEFSYRTIINAVPATVYFTYTFSSATQKSGAVVGYYYRYYTLTVEYQQDRVIPDGEASHNRYLRFKASYASASAEGAIDYAGFTGHDWETFVDKSSTSAMVKCVIPNDTNRNTIYTVKERTEGYDNKKACVIKNVLYNADSGYVGYDPDTTTDYITEYMAMPPVRDFYKLTAVDHITDEEAPGFEFKNWKNNDAVGWSPSKYGIYNYIRLTFDGVTPIVSRDIFLRDDTTTAEINLTDDERTAMRRCVTEGTTANITYSLDNEWKPTIYSDSGHPSIGTSEWVYSSTLTATYTLVDAIPVITDVTLTDIDPVTTALTGNNAVMVRYASDVQYVVTAEARKEATIDTITAETTTEKVTGVSGTFTDIEADYVTICATDNRGNKIYRGLMLAMVDYFKPTCSLASGAISSSGECNLEAKGNFFNGSFGAKDNNLSVQCRYKLANGDYGAWQTMNISMSGNTYTATATITGLDYREQYVFQLQATDLLRTATTPDVTLVSKPIFSWSKEDFLFETDVRIKGNLRLKGEGNYGNTLFFGDSSYAYIKEGTDDDLTFRATDITLDATKLYLNGSTTYINGYELPFTGVQSGTWTPTLTTSAAVSYYDVQEGWWQRVGNIVTIGFIVKASCNSGYNSTQVYLSGLPYTPSVAAFGGGVAHNLYMTGGFCFEGWTADTSGKISARIQPCNNTAAGNLNIASSTYYPSGGGTVTLAGTICYTM